MLTKPQSGGTPLILRMTLAIRLASPGLGSSIWKLRVSKLYREPYPTATTVHVRQMTL